MIKYSNQAKKQLQNIKLFISKDNKSQSLRHLKNIKEKIEILEHFPYLGKINSTKNKKDIRDFVILGYKVIYKINIDGILILAIYKHIDFDEDGL